MAERRRRSIFDLMDEFRREMDRFFESMIPETVSPPLHDVERRALSPLCQITETENEVIVVVDLPCVRKEDIRINATEDTLTIEAPMRECVRLPLLGGPIGETEFETFRRTLPLPVRVSPGEAKARFKEGILEVRFPKRVRGPEIKVD